MELLWDKILWKNQGGRLLEVRTEEALKGKEIIMFYFGFSECKRNVAFLSTLKDTYEVVTTHNIPLEIVYISTERNLIAFQNHFLNDHGDWLAVPGGDEIHLLLEYKYEVTSIPRAIVVRKCGSVITLNGHNELLNKGKYAISLWISPFV